MFQRNSERERENSMAILGFQDDIRCRILQDLSKHASLLSLKEPILLFHITSNSSSHLQHREWYLNIDPRVENRAPSVSSDIKMHIPTMTGEPKLQSNVSPEEKLAVTELRNAISPTFR